MFSDRLNPNDGLNKSESSVYDSQYTVSRSSQIPDNQKQQDTEDNQFEVTERSWLVRTFSPMTKGSIRSSIIALMSCTMGSGILALPYNNKISGVLLGSLLMLIGAFISRLCMQLLMECSFKSNTKSYTEQIQVTLGMKWRRVFEADVIFYVFGVVTCQQVIFSQFLKEVLQYFDVNDINLWGKIFSFSFIVLNLPFTLLKDVYSLRYFSQLLLGVIAYIFLIMSIYFVLMINTNKIKKEITYFHVNIDIFSSIATTLYGYICHQLLFPIRSELAKSSKKRMNKVCDRTVFFTFLIYIIVMNVGYFTWVGDTESIVITNYTQLPFIIGKMAFALGLFFSVPINVNPMRYTLLECLGKTKCKKTFIISTVIIQVSSGFLAYFYPNAKTLFSFLGGFLGTNIMVTFPCAIFMKMHGINKKTIFILIICSITVVLGYIGSVLSLVHKS